ncbi:MAG TPA: glycoside hydrolase family 15 protein [Thermoanaerobaculia bacterium]
MPDRPQRLPASYAPIADYAVVGDCRCAALVSKAGSLDWLCAPRFDSPAIFAAILDAQRGGRFSIRPAGPFAVSRRYLEGTNLLATTFTTARGVLRLTDAFAVADMAERRREPRPDHELLRKLECLEGEVEVEVCCDPRPDFGARPARPRDRRRLGWAFEIGPQVLYLQSQIPLAPGGGSPDGTRLAGQATLGAGERRYLSLAFACGAPAAIPPLGAAGEHAEVRLERSRRWWQAWSGRCRYEGARREAVLRSILALKLLTYAPSGAVVAAPTTSLPEELGGSRNWDYRYCWLRDASWTLAAFFDLGYQEEGKAFLSWLLDATRLHHRELGALYDLFGREPAAERELGHLAGYRGSRPVRVGNAAAGQLQLDIYGELIESAADFVRRGGELDSSQARLLARLGDLVCRLWRSPDEGIWEKRSGRFHHTYSKMMCWVALDRLLDLAKSGRVQVDVERLGRERAEIRTAIESRGWNAALASYVDVFDGEGVDASLLLFGIYGYCDEGSPRFASTVARVERELGRDDLLYRYPPASDGLPGGESAFVLCGFWAVECLARRGEVEPAMARFDHLLAFANDLGLYAEEIDPATGAFRGNFPQAFSHVGLINAALAIAEAQGRSSPAATAGKTGARA